MPIEAEYRVYVRPDKLIEKYTLISWKQVWCLHNEVCDRRVRLWFWNLGRGKELKLSQPNIDSAQWKVVGDSDAQLHCHKKAYGYILTYVGDFLVVAEKGSGLGSRRRLQALGKSISPAILVNMDARSRWYFYSIRFDLTLK